MRLLCSRGDWMTFSKIYLTRFRRHSWTSNQDTPKNLKLLNKIFQKLDYKDSNKHHPYAETIDVCQKGRDDLNNYMMRIRKDRHFVRPKFLNLNSKLRKFGKTREKWICRWKVRPSIRNGCQILIQCKGLSAVFSVVFVLWDLGETRGKLK